MKHCLDVGETCSATVAVMHTLTVAFHAGMIGTKCSPSQIVGDAVMDARSICMREYASAPEVNIYGDPNFTFPYVPSHLHHMAFELVKNSLRAVNDKFDDLDVEPPPIRLVIAEGEEDITIKVDAFCQMCNTWVQYLLHLLKHKMEVTWCLLQLVQVSCLPRK